MPKKALIFWIVQLIVVLQVKAQLVVDFTADTVRGCAPLTVQFEDNSSGGTIIFRRWQFTPTSLSVGNKTQVSATFVSSGLYNISLTAGTINDTITTTKTAFIEVFEPPVPDFETANQTTAACIPMDVPFTDLTNIGSSGIQQWSWTFGDGSSPVGTQNPQHTYQFPGSYTVSLTVTDSNSCSASTSKAQYIEARGPTANFTSLAPPYSCQSPLQVSFQDQSTSLTTLQYNWRFGTGDTAATKNPVYTYQNNGNYTVTLIVTDVYGCSDTLSKPNFVSIDLPVADFTISEDTLCLGEEATFTSTSVGLGTYTWRFGDGTQGFDPVEEHAYQTPGLKTITLVGQSGVQCVDSISKTVFVEQVIADFTSTPNYACEIPASATFTDQSQGRIKLFRWHFSLDSTQLSGNPVTKIFDDFGTSDNRLIVESYNGCRDTIIKPLDTEIFKIEPNFVASKVEGCAPLTVNFTDLSTPSDSIASWHWDFDTGDTSVLQNPSYTFNQDGFYGVRLMLTTPTGCTFSDSLTILVGAKPVADFSVDTTYNCAEDSIVFQDLSTDSSLVNAWTWAFGDGFGSTERNPTYFYKDTGWMDVALIVGYNGCLDTIIKPNYLYIAGPFAEFNYNFDCASPYDYNFQGTTKGADSFYWSFGGLFPDDSVNLNPSVTFPYSGRFDVELRAFNSQTGCEWLTAIKVDPRAIEADLTIRDSAGCAPFLTQLDATGSVDYSNGKFQWLVNGNPLQERLARVNFREDSTGIYNIMVVAEDENGCLDTANGNVGVFKPKANFTVDTTSGCIPLTVNFTDLSTSDTTLVDWYWLFGDGKNSNQQNPVHTYSKLGIGRYNLKLTVTDTFGCKADIQSNDFIRVYQPLVQLNGPKEVCEGDTVVYQNLLHQSGYTYQWDAGAGAVPANQRFRTTFSQGGIYDLAVTVTDTRGCDSVVKRTDFVEVQALPVAQIQPSLTDTSCYPATLSFLNTLIDTNVIRYTWDFGTDDPAITTVNPQASYTFNYPGVFPISVLMETSFGCLNTTFVDSLIRIRGPYAQFSIEADTACVNQNVGFVLDTSFSVASYSWDFASGEDTTLFASVNRINYAYTFGSLFTPSVTFRDSSGNCIKSFQDTLYIDEVSAQMQLTEQEGCTPFSTNFTDQSTNANAWLWFVNDSLVTTNTAGSFAQSNAGNYNLVLVSINERTNCSDTASNTLTINPLPSLRVDKPPILCEGDTARLSVSGAEQFRWQPFRFMASDTLQSPLIWPNDPITYTIFGTDSNGCINQIQSSIGIQRPFAFEFQQDTSLFLGESFESLFFSPQVLVTTWNQDNDLSCTNCPRPIVTPNETQTYFVRIRDPFGCFQVDTSFTVEVLDEFSILFPNAFTPNGDGINDSYVYNTYGIKSLVEFQIFDRWGRLVFETTDLNQGWDGSVNGEIVKTNSVFVYKALFERFTGEVIERRGSITLIR